MSRKDVIRWVIDWMMANDDAITQDLAARAEVAARAEWGGQRIEYIAKHCGPRGPGKRLPEAMERAITEAASGTQSKAQLADAMGVSRDTIYRALKRRKQNHQEDMNDG